MSSSCTNQINQDSRTKNKENGGIGEGSGNSAAGGSALNESLLSASADETIYKPSELDYPLRNPDKGWIAYDFNPIRSPGGAEITPLASTVYTNFISWGDLEPYEGQYRWDRIDKLINAYPGRKLKIAIVLLDPTSRPWCGASGSGQTPIWLSNKLFAAGNGRWVSSVEGMPVNFADSKQTAEVCGSGPQLVFEPHYWNATFLEAHGKFIWALARRYFYNTSEVTKYEGAPDWSERISGIDLATFGVWGEWHSDLVWPSPAVKKVTLNTMQLHYFQAFSSYAAVSKKDPPELEQSTVGSTLGVANHIYSGDDPSQVRFSVEKAPSLYGIKTGMVRKFLGADTSLFFQEDEQRMVSSNGATTPFRLEWGSFTGALTEEAFRGKFLTSTPMTVDRAVEYALYLGANAIGWYRNQEKDNFPLSQIKQGQSMSIENYFQKYSGYHFFVSEFKFPKVLSRGDTLTIDQVWQQRALGKLYRKHYFAAYLENEKNSYALGISDTMTAHQWPLGMAKDKVMKATFAIPAGVVPGTYTLKFAVVDRSGNPAMNLAISGKDIEDRNAYGKYVLGQISVR
jgi:hypothetical protein